MFRKYRDALKTVRSPTSDGVRADRTPSQKGIELAAASLLHPNAPRSYAPLSTEDPATSRFVPIVNLMFLLLFFLGQVFYLGLSYCIVSEINR